MFFVMFLFSFISETFLFFSPVSLDFQCFHSLVFQFDSFALKLFLLFVFVHVCVFSSVRSWISLSLSSVDPVS